MVKIVSDTGTMYSIEEGRALGIDIAPLSIFINNKSYREIEEISTKELYEIINQGHIPISSQPALGEILEAYNRNGSEEVLNITMSDGLSGTYNTACAARKMVNTSENITVLNSKTLCGPQRYLVNKAADLAREGKSVKQILEVLTPYIESSISFLIPKDFEYLKRGGRLTSIAATISSVLNLVPILSLTADSKRLEKFAVKRTFVKAVDSIIDYLIKMKVDKSYNVSISHALDSQLAEKARARIEERIPGIGIDIFELTPVFLTQGGPKCVSIQVMKK